MTTLPEPPDLEPDEDRILELAALVPPADDRFASEVQARLDQRTLGTNLATVSSWVVVAAAVQLFMAVATLFGATPSQQHPPKDTDHE